VTGLCLFVFTALSDPSSFDKSTPPQVRTLTLRNVKIQGIGSRVLVPSDRFVVVSGERVSISFSGKDAVGASASGSVEGVVTTVIPGLGFWVRFPSLDLVNGAYPPSPVPPTVDEMSVSVELSRTS
jgi:hypothetical protein